MERDAGLTTAARIRSILASRSLTLHQVSGASERLYGSESPASIPHTLYHSLEKSHLFGPSLAQTCALSRISGYQLEDWVHALGINPGAIAGLEAALSLKRTRLIDPFFARADRTQGGPEELDSVVAPADVFPLGLLLRWRNTPPVETAGPVPEQRRCFFARIGAEDVFAFPEIVPGSIVRIRPHAVSASVVDGAECSRPELLLIEHDRGLWCGRFHLSDKGILYATSPEVSYAPIAFRVPNEARVLGVVDIEIRWTDRFETPMAPAAFATYWQPPTLERESLSPGALVRRARHRADLTLHEASLLSKRVAQFLGDERYAIAQSTLSEYEVQNTPPRHLEKVMTLCLIYGIGLLDFVQASGIAPEDLGTNVMPAEFLGNFGSPATFGLEPVTADRDDPEPASSSFLLGAIGEVPWFLRHSVTELSEVDRPSLRDFFRMAGDHPFLPAYAQSSMLALVNRRKQKPIRRPERPTWQQPAYVLRLRSGEYHCACCSLDGDTLILYPGSGPARWVERLRMGQDVEVIGQIVGLARHIS